MQPRSPHFHPNVDVAVVNGVREVEEV